MVRKILGGEHSSMQCTRKSACSTSACAGQKWLCASVTAGITAELQSAWWTASASAIPARWPNGHARPLARPLDQRVSR